MACNSCFRDFTLLRKEKGCPSCGFSYCSQCLNSKIFVPKLNSEAKVCTKCKSAIELNENTNIEPPEAYYKRIAAIDKKSQAGSKMNSGNSFNLVGSSKDQEILDRLQKLKDDKSEKMKVTNEDIAKRLEKIKELPSTSDSQLQLRLANLRGVPVTTLQSKSVAVMPDSRTEQEQVDDLIKQYAEQISIDEKYQGEFKVIDNIQTRLQKLKNSEQDVNVAANEEESEDEDEVLNKIIKKIEAESRMENDVTQSDPQFEEFPFCEICDEDAKMKCLGCKYLFCKQCFIEHKDKDAGCDKYVYYRPPNNSTT